MESINQQVGHDAEFAACLEVAQETNESRPDSTKRQYGSKQVQFIDFCKGKKYADGDTVTENKLPVWLMEIGRNGARESK